MARSTRQPAPSRRTATISNCCGRTYPNPSICTSLGGGATLLWTDRGDPEGNTLNRATVQPTVGTSEIVSSGYREAIGVAAASETEFYVTDLGGSIRHVDLDSGTDTELVNLGSPLTGIALADL